MRNKLHIFICCLGISLAGCNHWLDVRPETEVYLEDMFANQQGFQDALIGAYFDLKDDNAYGQELMFGAIEYLAQHWDYAAESVEEKISRYNYIDASVQARFTNIYSQLYSTIASANVILEYIDQQKEVFEPGMYEIIKGEALAMRAFCHFDLLRLFGPMPTQTDGSRILPYVTITSIDYHEHHTYEMYTTLLETDLLLADSLLKYQDPISPYSQIADAEDSEGLSVSASDFLLERQLRFNYYAVKALEARFYLWLGDEKSKGKAYVCAKEVINAADEEGNLFTLALPTELTEDYAFSKEHILAVYDYTLSNKAKNNFTENTPYSKEKELVTYDLYVAGTTDTRFQMWREYITSGGTKLFTIQKFIQKTEDPINQIPLIRLSEMYFIGMECGTLAEANQLYEEFCIARDIPVVEISNNVQLKNILNEEYNKEFYGEGQAFYAFKRWAVEDILWAKDPGDAASYVVPLPLNEVNYNN